jgi:hypothetical protein
MPSSRRARAKRCASGASSGVKREKRIGTMGWTPGLISKPAAVIRSRNVRVLASRRSRRAVVCESSSSARRVAPATTGGRVFEKR